VQELEHGRVRRELVGPALSARMVRIGACSVRLVSPEPNTRVCGRARTAVEECAHGVDVAGPGGLDERRRAGSVYGTYSASVGSPYTVEWKPRAPVISTSATDASASRRRKFSTSFSAAAVQSGDTIVLACEG
jgi:hypothetical protein